MAHVAGTVYVLTIQSFTGTNPLPEVFGSLDGAKEYVQENWAVTLKRINTSEWTASGEDFRVRLVRRFIFDR